MVTQRFNKTKFTFVMSALLCIFVLTCLFAYETVKAQDRIQAGPTYPIAENDFLKSIEAQLKAKQKSGELARLEQVAKEQSMNTMRNPKPLDLTRALVERTYYFDPTVTATQDLRTPDGKLIAAKGTRANPLDVVSMSKRLVFFDARDKDQVAYAWDLMQKYPAKVKPVLTGGSYLDLMKKWQTTVFYDQAGTLTAKFGIQHVPAVVAQENKRLRIDEVLLP